MAGDLNGLLKVVADAKRSLRRMKKCAPHLYPEYIEMLHAKAALVRAKEKYLEAKKRWEQLGK